MSHLFAAALAVSLWSEKMNRSETEKGLYKWLRKRPESFVLLFFLVFSTYVFAAAVFGMNGLTAAAVTVFIMLLSAGNKYKKMFRGDNVFPWDLGLQREAGSMAGLFGGREIAVFAAMLAAFAVLLALSFPGAEQTVMQRSVLVAESGFFILFTVFFACRRPANFARRFRGAPGLLNQWEMYEHFGFWTAFLFNVPRLHAGRRKKTADRNGEDFRPVSPVEAGKKQPHVIVIMDESFWNPALMENLVTDRSPVPCLEKAAEEGGSGFLAVSELGGGTCNIEYEFLTGRNMSFHPTGSTPFIRDVRGPVPTLADSFGAAGYRTVCLHSYEKWFWKRNRVYKRFGFDRFVAADGFEAPEIKGDFIGDRSFARKVIDIFEESEEPLFLYGITMQNHGPYDGSRYNEDEKDVRILSGLGGAARREAETYLQGVFDADRSLGMLTDYFSNREEDVILVFFGDHLPMLGRNFSSFIELDFLSDNRPSHWNGDEKRKMYSTPFIYWKNHEGEKEDMGLVGASFLGAFAARDAGVPLTPFLDHVAATGEKMRVVSERMGNIYRGPIETEEARRLVEEYREKQYSQLR